MDELPVLDVKTVNDTVIIDSNNLTFDIVINGKRLGSFNCVDGHVNIILHPDKLNGYIWIDTNRNTHEKKTSNGNRWVDLV
jgi:predicted nucleic acid-binding protein